MSEEVKLPAVGVRAAFNNKEERSPVDTLESFADFLHEAAHFRIRREYNYLQ